MTDPTEVTDEPAPDAVAAPAPSPLEGAALASAGETAGDDDAHEHALGAAPSPPAGAEGDDAAPAPLDASPTFIVVEVTSVAFPLPSPNPTVHLREVDFPYRGLEFPLGLPEAQSIAMAIDHESAPRPTTHELLSAVLAASGTDVVALRFTAERSGTLLAELDLMTPRGREVIDCRPSDGIAVALRQSVPAPILCEESLLDR